MDCPDCPDCPSVCTRTFRSWVARATLDEITKVLPTLNVNKVPKRLVKMLWRARTNPDPNVFSLLMNRFKPALSHIAWEKLQNPVNKNNSLSLSHSLGLKCEEDNKLKRIIDALDPTIQSEYVAEAIIWLTNKNMSAARINQLLDMVPDPSDVARRTLIEAIRRDRRGLIGNYLTRKLVTLKDIQVYVGLAYGA